jgi:hypothetical protein
LSQTEKEKIFGTSSQTPSFADVSGTNAAAIPSAFVVTQMVQPGPALLNSFRQSVELLFNSYIEDNLPAIEMRIAQRFEERIKALEDQLDTLTTVYEIENPPEQYDENRVITEHEVQEYILNNVQVGEVFYPSDIADKMGTDLMTVLNAVKKLKEQDRIGNKGI